MVVIKVNGIDKCIYYLALTFLRGYVYLAEV